MIAKRTRRKVHLGSLVLVTIVSGFIASAVELAGAFPKYAHLIAAAALFFGPWANQMKASVRKEPVAEIEQPK